MGEHARIKCVLSVDKNLLRAYFRKMNEKAKGSCDFSPFLLVVTIINNDL